jgi:FKBP-type peptidyl-prolyl cis-trans isomerase
LASSSATAAAPAESANEQKGEDDWEYVVEEEITTVPGWTPSVTLDVKDSIECGEENEEELYSQRSKLYRFRDGDWKERGTGEAKLLKHKENGKVRFMLRQEKTLKIVGNHYVIEHATYCDLRPNTGSDKCWVWTAQDSAEEELATEQFALKFGSAELANSFKEAFNNAKELNKTAIDLSAAAANDEGRTFLDTNKTKDGVVALESGLQYKVLTAGKGKTHPEPDSVCVCHYIGKFLDGTKFESSYDKKEPANLKPAKVIEGWKQAMLLMVEGAKWELWIPAKLAYGAEGKKSSPDIPGGTTLHFEIELLEIKDMKKQAEGQLPQKPAEEDKDAAGDSPPQESLFSKALHGVENLFGMGTKKAESTGAVPSNPEKSASATTGSSLFGNSSSGGGFFSSSASSGGLFASQSSGGLFSASASSGGLFAPQSSGVAPLLSWESSSSSSFGTGSSGASLFGAGTGSSLFGGSSGSSGGLFGQPLGSSAAPDTAPPADDDRYVEEEEVTHVPGWAPSVTLEVREHVATGEEDEEEVYKQRSKLYRFKDKEWKERGTGEAKLLRNPKTGQTRFLLRQERTMKVVANHFVIDQDPYCVLKPNQGSEKCWVWTANGDVADADEPPQTEQFALKFGSADLAAAFKEAFDKVKTKPDLQSSGPSGSAAKLATKSEPEAPSKNEKDEEDDEEDDYDYGDDADEEPSTNHVVPSKPCGSLAEMAAQQAASGWKCSVCGLRWPEEKFECNACETPRPGYEDKAKAQGEDKKKGQEAAAALFTGKSLGAESKGSGFTFSQPASTTGFTFSAAASSSSTITFGAPASSSSAVTFGQPASAGIFSAPTQASSGGFFNSPFTSPSPLGASSGGAFGVGHTPVVVPPPPKAQEASAPSSGGGLFGQSATSLFGSGPSSGGLFSASPSSGSSLFGAPASAGSGFSNTPASSSTTPAAVFGGSSSSGFTIPAAGTTLFGGASASSSSGLFSKSAATAAVPTATGTPGLFGATPAAVLPPPPPPPPIKESPPLETHVNIESRSAPLEAPMASAVPANTADLQQLLQTIASQMPMAGHVPAVSSGLQVGADLSTLPALQKEIKRLSMQVQDISETAERAEARARKAEEKLRTSEDRSDRNEELLRGSLDQVKQKQLEDSIALQSLKAEQAQASATNTTLQADLRGVQASAREAAASAREAADTAHTALKASEEAKQAVHNLESAIKDRVGLIESKVTSSDVETLGNLSMPERIRYLTSLHKQSLTAPLVDSTRELRMDYSRPPPRGTVQPLLRKHG